jgi:hypothetical protein
MLAEPITADAIAALPVEQRGREITLALVRSKDWLAIAVRSTDPGPVEEFKAWAATVEEMTRQKGLGKEIQLDAQEMVRRAERGLGLIAQERVAAGLDRGDGQRDTIANQYHSAPAPAGGRSSLRERTPIKKEYGDIRDMTVGVSDEVFNEVIEESRDEGNLSRQNVAAKARERSGRPPRGTPRESEESREYEVEVDGESVCYPYVFREEKVKQVDAWALAGSNMIPELSVYERNFMLQVILKLDGELRKIPIQVQENAT